MDKQPKQNFIQLALNSFKKKFCHIPHFLFQTKLQKSAKNLMEIKKLIQDQQYEYIGQVSEERNLYCCKQKTNDRLVIIEIKQVSSKNNKNIYLSINLTPALKKDIRKYFMLKNWKILDKIYLQDQKGSSGLVLIEYNFVEKDLRNYLKRQLQLDQKFTMDQIRNICQNIIQNLCYYHLQSTALLDIRPQTILYQDGKWFILNGDNSLTNKMAQFGSNMSKSVGFKPISSLYLSPLMYQSYMKNDTTIPHNPYKSDVYSLGLILWQILHIGILEPMQIKAKLENRKYPYVQGIKYSKYFNLRQKIIIQNNNAYSVPNILTMMLEESQDHRNYIVQICLSLNFTNSLFSKIIAGFEDFFKKQIIDYSQSSRKKIQYSHVGIQYQGDTIEVNNKVIKNGRGTITHNNIKVFDGEWKNNLPHGKCTLSFSQMWNYQGLMEEGKLNGQGMLTFNGIRIGGTKWIKNLEEQLTSTASKKLEYGYYIICPSATQKPHKNSITQATKKQPCLMNITNSFNSTQSNGFSKTTFQNKKSLDKPLRHNTFHLSSLNASTQYKVYFQQIHNNKSKYMLNFTKIQTNEITRLIQILINNKMFISSGPQSINLYEDIKYERYYEGKACDILRIGLKQKNQILNEKNRKSSLNSRQSLNLQIKPVINSNVSFSEPSVTKDSKKNFPHSQFDSSQTNSSQNLYIDIILEPKTGSLILNKFLKMLPYYFTSQQPQITQTMSNSPKFILSKLILSSSNIQQDQFRQLIQIPNIRFQYINISKCKNLTDNSIKYLCQCKKNWQNLIGLNLSHLKITNKSLEEFKFCQGFKSLSYLNLSFCDKLTSQKLADFLIDQKLSNVKILQLAGLDINHRSVQKISKYSKLYSLQKLNIGVCHQIGQISLSQLVKSPQLSKLKALLCYSTTIKDYFLQTLSQQKTLDTQIPQLQELNLSGSINLTIYGISKFFLSKNSKNIISLNLSNLDIPDQFVQLLGKKNLLNPNLTELNLSACYKISDKGIKQLLKSQKMVNIKKLDLSKTNISNDTLFMLAQSMERKLEEIKFYKCSKMNDYGFEKFLVSPAVVNVRKLEIGGTSIKSIFFTVMASEKTGLDIQQLSINECQQIDEKSLCILLASKKASKIRLLDISMTKLSGKVLQAIHKNPYLKSHLMQLIMTNCVNMKCSDIQKISIPNSLDFKNFDSEHIVRSKTSQLAQSSLLLKMTELEVSHQIQNLQKIFSSNYIINLSKLQIKWQQCSLQLKSLANNVVFNNFKQLSLLGSKFDQTSLIELIQNSTVKNLQTLNLSWTDITNQTLLKLSNSQFITSLRNLNLSKCNNFNDKGLIKFLMSSKASLLLSLDLRSTLITNSSLQALGKSKNIKSLTKLILRSCPNITQTGFKDFFLSGNSSNLRQLDISWTRITGTFFLFLSKGKCVQLNSLRISGLKNIQFQLNKFISTLSCSSLTQLQMNYTQLSAQTLSAFSSSKYLQTLQKFQILGYQIVSNQQKYHNLIKLLQSSNMTKLINLKLSCNNLSQKLAQNLFNIIQRNLHVIEKLSLINAAENIIVKGKKILKKCQIICQE